MNPIEMDMQKMVQPARNIGATIWNVIWTTFVFTIILQAVLTALWLLITSISYVGMGSFAFFTETATVTVAFLNFIVIPTAVFVWRLIRARKVYDRQVASHVDPEEWERYQAWKQYQEQYEHYQMMVAQQNAMTETQK